MSQTGTEQTVRLQQLMRRKVVDADGKVLGRLQEVEAGRIGSELGVVAILIGPGSWLTRFSWSPAQHGTRVPWTRIESIDPVIKLRREGTE
jgi:sporulation protein YlmC with PRC-barrel domain